MLKKKKEKKMEKVKSRMYLYILENVVKCLPQARLQTSVWWRLSETNDETNYTKVQYAMVIAWFDVFLSFFQTWSINIQSFTSSS